LGNWAVSEFHESVRSKLVIEANTRLNGKLIDPATGSVRLEELASKGGLSFLTSPEVWNEIDEESRPAMEFARGNLNTILNVEAIKGLRLINDKVAANQSLLLSTHSTISDIERTARTLNTTLNSASQGIKDLGARSGEQSAYLKALVASANLPPRQRLALSAQGLVDLQESERRLLQRAVDVEPLQAQSSAFSKRLGDTAAKLQNIRGVNPEVIAKFNQGSAIFSSVTDLTAAYVSQDYLSMGLGVMSIAGQIGAFGKKRGPSAEQAMLASILRELQALSRKIDAYHAQEMAALDQISQDIAELRVEMVTKFGEVDAWLARLNDQLETLLQDPLNTCYALEQGYDNYFSQPDKQFLSTTLSGFADWVDATPARQQLDDCRYKLEVMLSPIRNGKVPSVFLPMQHGGTSPAIPGMTFQRKQAAVTQLFRTTREYVDHYGLGGRQVAAVLRREHLSLSDAGRSPLATSKLPAADDDVVRVVGPNLIDPLVVLEASRLLRMVMGWQNLLWDGGALRGVRGRDLDTCKKSPPTCHIRDARNFALVPLKNALLLLERLLEQEQLAAGGPVIGHVARALEADVIPRYARARAGADSGDLQRLLTRESSSISASTLADPFRARMKCASGSSARDALCLMQANPLIAENALSLFVAGRLRSRGMNLSAYRAALGWGTDSLLRDVLGSDLNFFDSSSLIPDQGVVSQRHWVIELPRVFTKSTVQPNTANAGQPRKETTGLWLDPPKTCWDERGAVEWDASSRHWDDALDVQDATPVGDPRWARCYPLPNPETLEANSLIGRERLDEIREEIRLVQRALAHIETVEKPSRSSAPKSVAVSGGGGSR
jgi:hypothetical protein